MKLQNQARRLAALLLTLSMLLSLVSCGNEAKATTMHLKRAEGTVAVSDDAGEDVPLLEDLGLYSGYGVNTRLVSFAWINLDDVKLTKMDEDSEIAITKEDKLLEIEVKSGSLFFNVTEPLAEDETMNIRTSTMLVGIRGTCGWVALSEDGNTLTVFLLEGRVECSNGENTATVSAGEKGTIPASGEITVEEFSRTEVPAYVTDEVEEELLATLPEDGGSETGEPGQESETGPVDPMRLRDMYTYSRSLNYNVNDELVVEQTFFPDELGRIGKMVVQDGSETVYEYIYNEAGTLSQRVRADGTIVAVVTEDTPDHRIIINPERPDRIYTYYYDEQGRTVSAEYVGENNHGATYTYTYDAEGKLIRTDCYDLRGDLSSYSLYEYD